jgi:hypothetical protein
LDIEARPPSKVHACAREPFQEVRAFAREPINQFKEFDQEVRRSALKLLN